MNPGPFTFFHPLRVRWAEVDAQGIVFNPHYLMYFDVAFTEYMRAIGLAYPEGLTAIGADIFAASSQLSFRDAAAYDDVLAIGVRATQLGRTSLVVAFCVCRGSATLTEGQTTYVVADRLTRKPQPLPAMLTEAILAYEQTPPVPKPR